MSERKSFIIHIDSLSILSEMSDEHAGMLLKAMLHYQTTGEVVLDGMLKIIFIPFKNQFDRDKEKYQAICDRNKINGIKGGRKQAKRTQKNPVGASGGQSNPVGADNDSKNDSKSKSDNKPDGVSEVVWLDFLAHRKAKGASITETVIKGFQREADKAGITLEQAFEMAVLRGWTGFNADWLKDARPGPQSGVRTGTELPRKQFRIEDAEQ